MNSRTRTYIAYRALEIFPGLMVWLTFAALFALSFMRPLYAIYFIILFDLYWMLRISYLMTYVLISWSRFRKTSRIDWSQALERDFGASADKRWKDYWHIIFLPTYKEPYAVIQASLSAIVSSTYGRKDRMLVVLAGEEQDREKFSVNAARAKQEFGHRLHTLLTTLHPHGVPGELSGKGSNLYYAGHQAQAYIDELGIEYKKIIVSTFDVDTVAHPQYFSHLTYQFLNHPNPYRASFQPLTLYHNNIWESDPLTRVVANSTTFWLLTDLARSDRLFTFSSHSMSWQALVDIGFWQNNIVTEDSRIFLQCLVHYDGDYEVFPMYIPVSMNTVYMGSLFRSLVNQYKQMRRWAYGVEHFPYMVWHFAHNSRIPFKKKLTYIWNQTEGVYSWATAPIIMFVGGRLPLIVSEANRDTSFIAQQTPLILSTIMTGALWGIIVIAIMSTLILPPKPMKGFRRIIQYAIMLLQWALFPITMIVFGALPAIDAQTRLMIGKYLDFWVTEKRSESDSLEKSGMPV
ncbi:MAG: glycosyltransferase family 2 protein [Candidatus Komeilibacteria bacterium]|nr:glycosyltransferase family 2 protein [Candidatus Komeilibacteria bacterium]